MRSANGSLVLLTGEPGIGKTRLASELARAARERGVTPAWGRCWEAGGAPAFWPWREAYADLGIQFPQTVAVATNDPTEARFALFGEVARLLSRASAFRLKSTAVIRARGCPAATTSGSKVPQPATRTRVSPLCSINRPVRRY